MGEPTGKRLHDLKGCFDEGEILAPPPRFAESGPALRRCAAIANTPLWVWESNFASRTGAETASHVSESSPDGHWVWGAVSRRPGIRRYSARIRHSSSANVTFKRHGRKGHPSGKESLPRR